MTGLRLSFAIVAIMFAARIAAAQTLGLPGSSQASPSAGAHIDAVPQTTITNAKTYDKLTGPASLSEISSCLCLKNTLDAQKTDVDQKKSAADAERAGLVQEKSEIDAEKTGDYQTNPNAGRVSERHDRRVAAFNVKQTHLGQTAAVFQTAANGLNDSISRYNAQCVGRPMDQKLMDQAKANLVCPAP